MLNEKDKLLPCPFCGANAQVIEEVAGFPDELEYFVLCDDLECENRTGPHSTGTAAVTVWNRRTPDVTAMQAELARYKADEAETYNEI